MPNYLSPGVYVEEREAGSRPIEGVGTAVAAFVGITASGPFNEPTLITNWGQFVSTFGDFVPGSYTPLSVYQYFNNGGGSCYVIRVGANGAVLDVPTAMAQLSSASQPDLSVYRVVALEPGLGGNGVAVEVVADGAPPAEEGQEPAPSESFTLVVKQHGDPVERFEGLTTRRGRQHVATIVNERSAIIRIEELGSTSVPERMPAAGEFVLEGGGPAPVPERMGSDDFVGDSSTRSGLGALESIDGVTMVAMPDVMAAYQHGFLDLERVQVVQQALIDHCERMGDRVAVLDPPPGLNAQQVKDWRVERAGYDSKFATLYWPWIKVYDPGTGATDFVPPSGAIAGIWGRNDDTRGVHKAPANEVVRGAVDLEINVTRGEHDQLNPVGINVIRAFPGRGIRVWGARTLSSDPAWRYLNVRRLFNYMEASIFQGTQWVVFEPNDLDLWQRVKRTISSFLLGLWRDGALFGATPAQAFYVKCDAETNPPDVVDRGQLIVEIGVCPVKPAEFVIFRLSQFSGGGDVTE
jgi:uncharacterized protein